MASTRITAVCPQCQSEYTLEASLRGSRMRCPNPQCREVFVIGQERSTETAPPATTNKGQTSGTINELVPLLPAEVHDPRPRHQVPDLVPLVEAEMVEAEIVEGEPIEPPPSKPPHPSKPKPPAEPNLPTGAVVHDWKTAPPPAPNRAESPPERPAPLPRHPELPELVQATEVPDEPAPAKTVPEPPPVRRPMAEAPPPEPHHEDPEHSHARKKGRARRWMAVIVLAVTAILGGAGYATWMFLTQTEDRLYAQANEEKEKGSPRQAASKFAKLAEKFPDAARHGEHVFLARLCELRAELDDAPDTAAVLQRVAEFVREADKDPGDKARLDEHGPYLTAGFTKRFLGFLKEHEASNDPALSGLLDQFEETFALVQRRLPAAIAPRDAADIGQRVADYRGRIAIEKLRKAALEVLRGWVAQASAEKVKLARAFIRSRTAEIPGFDKDPETLALLKQITDAHLASVRYEPGPGAGAMAVARSDEAGILFDPLVGGRPQPGKDEGGVVLALSRGVLYALRPTNGQIRWALRVGVDTTRLPVRLPPSAAHPGERLLVLSADTRTLSAVDLDGRTLWRYALGAPCLGRPVVIGQRAYLGTFEPQGQVHEIELDGGGLIGRFRLGQSLSVGGVHQRLTERAPGGRPRQRDLIYFPADEDCVYVLDVTDRKCLAIMYTNHPGGTLRGEPLIVGDEESRGAEVAAGSWLLLNQTDGLEATTPRLYNLPATDREVTPVVLKDEPTLRGWTWFPPYHDAEKVMFLSDAAKLGLFGVKQARNNDPPLFSLLPPDEKGHAGIDLARYLDPPADRRRGQSLVAHVLGDEFWVLAYGQLQRLAVSLKASKGPEPARVWKRPLHVGSPLHGPQTLDGNLFLVTQPLSRPVTLATAVVPDAPDDDPASPEPRVLWQRQLGLVCRGEPLVVGEELLAQDQGGGLVRFNPRHFRPEADSQWQVGGQLVAGSFDLNPAAPPVLLSAGPRSAYQVAFPGGTRMLVRHYDLPQGAARPTVDEKEVELPDAKIAGNVCLLGSSLLVPLSNGKLVRYGLPLDRDARPAPGPDWRLPRALPGARCYMVPLGGNEFLTSDGRGLTLWHWPAGQLFNSRLPMDRTDPPTVELSDPVVTPPVVLPRNGAAGPRVMVGDARGVVHLLEGEHLAPTRSWELNGALSPTCFALGGKAAWVVDGRRLVLIDPGRKEPVWEHRTVGAIVGRPHQVEDVLVVADDAGRFVGLSPQTGKPQGETYTLRSAVAASASPVAFGAGRVFAPLTDGTVLLLSLGELRAPWWLWPYYAK